MQLKAGTVQRAFIVINPELIPSSQLYGTEIHTFIFGDVATAVVVESSETVSQHNALIVASVQSVSRLIQINIRSNFGYLTRKHRRKTLILQISCSIKWSKGFFKRSLPYGPLDHIEKPFAERSIKCFPH